MAAAASAAARALRARGYDLGESGRFPGLYKLLASGDAATRAEVRARGGVGGTHSELGGTRAEMGEKGPWTDGQLQNLELLALPT